MTIYRVTDRLKPLVEKLIRPHDKHNLIDRVDVSFVRDFRAGGTFDQLLIVRCCPADDIKAYSKLDDLETSLDVFRSIETNFEVTLDGRKYALGDGDDGDAVMRNYQTESVDIWLRRYTRF